MDLKERKEYLLQLIREFCEDKDYSKDVRYGFRDDYAGRGMFGRICVGIVCDDPVRAGMELTAYLAETATDGEYNTYDHLMFLGKPYVDSMGCSHILYFPDLITN